MSGIEFGEPGPSDDAEDLEVRRNRLVYAFMDLRLAVDDLIRSGAAQDGHMHTEELRHLEKLGEQLKGEPVRGVLRGTRYYTDPETPPDSYLSQEFYLPHGFETPIVMGIFEGAIKKGRLQENPELVIGVSPFALSDREDITEHYQKNYQALSRWHQPLGLKRKHKDQRLWLPAAEFKFELSHRDDDYLGAEIATSEAFRAGLAHKLRAEQPEAE